VLDPRARPWCAQLAELVEREEATLADMNELWQQRKRAAQRSARQLLASADLRAGLEMDAQRPRDTLAIARAITPALAERAATGALPLLPVLFAAIAIEIDYINRIGLHAEERL
jgi:hypothetical protein